MTQPKTSIQSQGGKARAASLSAEERQKISRAAARARWHPTEKPQLLPRAISTGNLLIENKNFSTVILNNGRQLITCQSLHNELTLPTNYFLVNIELKPQITPELQKLANPIEFRIEKNQTTYGYDAQLLPQICLAFCQWNRMYPEKIKLISSHQLGISTCERILHNLAEAGTKALIKRTKSSKGEKRQTTPKSNSLIT